MPYVFSCPDCNSTLKTATPIPADQTIHCPKCKATFTINDTRVDEVPSDSPSSSETSRRSELPSSDRNDPYERNRRDPGYDDRPRRDWDEDRSSSRRERDEDSRESRRYGRDDRADDRPKRRDEDDDGRPYRGHGPRSKGSNRGLIFGLSLLGLLLIGGIAWLAVREFGGSDVDMMSYLPKNTVAIIGVDMDAAMKLPETKNRMQQPEAAQAMKMFKDQFGLPLDEIERIVVGVADIDERRAPKVVVVVRSKSSINKNKMISSIGGSSATHNGNKYYKGILGALYFPSRDTVVFASDQALMTDEVLEGNGAVRFSSELQEMIKPLTNKQFWAAAQLTPDIKKQIKISKDDRKQAVNVLPKVGPLIDSLAEAKGFVAYIQSDGVKTKVALGLKLANAQKAKEFATAAKETIQDGVEKLMNMIGFLGMVEKDVTNFAKNTAKDTTTEIDGDIGYAVINVDNAESERLMEKYKDKLQNMQGNPGAFGQPPGPFGQPPGFGQPPKPFGQPPAKNRR